LESDKHAGVGGGGGLVENDVGVIVDRRGTGGIDHGDEK
jgi:hypothetical protein